MEHETLLKAMRYRYPQELSNFQILLGFEPAFVAVEDKDTQKIKHVPTGIPENSPNHARIATWPSHLPKPTVGDIEQWAAAYDAGEGERQVQETAKQAHEQNQVAIKARLKILRGTSIKQADYGTIIADILELLDLD